MFGLDRAAVWIKVEAEPELIFLGIKKRFPGSSPKKLAGQTQTFKILEENINEIRVKEKGFYTLIKVDFSYSKQNDNKIYPLSSEIEKVITEHAIIQIIKDITLENVKREDLVYDYLEICTQEEIKGFYLYHNIITCFYRALKRHYKSKNSATFEDYDFQLDKFYNTGFTFDVNPGWKIRLYNKTLENNKKNKKVMGANLRLEYRLTRTALDCFCKSARCIDLTIEYLRLKIIENIATNLYSHLKSEILRDTQILKERLQNYTSRDLAILVRDLQNNIIDEVVINNIVTELSTASKRQTIRYRNKIKDALKEYELNSSPKRSNFGNIERLNFFINNIIFYQSEVKCRYNLPLTFNDLKR